MPWPEGNSLEAVVQHINNPPEPLSTHNPDIPPEVEAIIMKGLAREPGDRWGKIRQMTDRLRDLAPKVFNGKSSTKTGLIWPLLRQLSNS